MMEQLSDEALMSAVMSGKSTALAMLVERYHSPLLGYTYRLAGGDRPLAEDIVQFEMVCPPPLLQLTIARLVLVLSYSTGLGLLLSLLCWMIGSGDVLTLTLAWLMPLMLVAGLALLLSLRWSIRTAAALAYGVWLTLLIVSITVRSHGHPAPLLTTGGIVLAGLVGLVLLLIAAFSLRSTTTRLLPY
jgi:hypothetical protein